MSIDTLRNSVFFHSINLLVVIAFLSVREENAKAIDLKLSLNAWKFSAYRIEMFFISAGFYETKLSL